MVKLGDYIGHLLSEISMARVRADLESINIAKMYAENDLLKTFPIPRVRLPNIELNVPVVVDKVNMELIYDTSIIDKNRVIGDAFDLIQVKINKLYRKKLTAEDLNLINKKNTDLIDKYLLNAKTLDEISIASKNIISQLVLFVNEIKKLKPSATNEKFKNELEQDFKEVLLNNIKSPIERLKNVEIAPETFKQKELGDSLKSLTLKLFITEDAIEWVETEKEDGTTNRFLVSE